jgi:hypothetical protein
LISSLVKSVRSEARRLLMSGFSALAGTLPIPPSVITVRVIIIALQMRGAQAEGGKGIDNSNTMLVSL